MKENKNIVDLRKNADARKLVVSRPCPKLDSFGYTGMRVPRETLGVGLQAA